MAPSSLPEPPPPQASWAYFLDLDGTLIALAPRPEEVVVSSDLPIILTRLKSAAGGAVAIVTGRPLDTVDRLLAPMVLPVAALHGLERRSADGALWQAPPASEALERVRAGFEAFVAGDQRLLVEDKRLTVALHFRLAPDRAADAASLADGLAAAVAPDLVPVKGKAVIEFKPPAIDKGTAIDAFLREPPFAGRRPVFLGDDVTDEDGFRRVNPVGGISIRIGDRGESAARFFLPDVPAAHNWLRQIPVSG